MKSLQEVRKSLKELRNDALYFGESQSRAVLSVKPEHQKDVRNLGKKFNVALYEIGKVGGDTLLLEDKVRMAVPAMKELFENTIPNLMEG